MWSQHITVSFLQTHKGCPCIFIINQIFPWPNHCCLTQVTHGEQKQKTHSCLSSSSSDALFPWPEWLTPTPAVTLMALLSQLLPCLLVSGSTLATVLSSVAKMAGQNCSWQEMSPRNSGKRETFHEHNPIHVLQTVLLSQLLAYGQTQTKSVYPFPRNSIMPTFQQWRENNCVWNVSHAMECRPVLVSQLLFGEPLGIYQR